MKLAVIGGGSTYTPELVEGSPGWPTLGVTELVLVDPDETRLAAVGPGRPPGSCALRAPGAGPVDDQTWTTALDGAGAVLIQLRVGGQAARDRDETWPHDYGCSARRPPGRAGWPRRCAPCRSCWTSPNECRRRAAARRVDHRLHQPGRHRDPGAARRRAPGGRAVQRGDRLPARSRRCSAWRPEQVSPRPRRAEPPDLDARGARRREGPAAGAARRSRRGDRRAHRAAAAAAV